MEKGLQPEQMTEMINQSSGKNFLPSQWPLTLRLFEIMTSDDVSGAKGAIFTTGMKDQSVTKKWAATDGIKLRSLENGIDHLDYLSGGKFYFCSGCRHLALCYQLYGSNGPFGYVTFDSNRSFLIRRSTGMARDCLFHCSGSFAMTAYRVFPIFKFGNISKTGCLLYIIRLSYEI